MLALLGLTTVVVLLAVIISKRMSPLIALILIPIIASLVGGFGYDTSKFVLDGLKSLAPVVGMFVFAILFFGIVTDAGMLDPIIDRILRTVGTRPTRIVMGTTLLALLIHLDGSGAVRFSSRFQRCCPFSTGSVSTSAFSPAPSRWQPALTSCLGPDL
jgi:citrate-Mg2+:H+ or citrate-Ca2+:H+ symporter, CitMHS family